MFTILLKLGSRIQNKTLPYSLSTRHSRACHTVSTSDDFFCWVFWQFNFRCCPSAKSHNFNFQTKQVQVKRLALGCVIPGFGCLWPSGEFSQLRRAHLLDNLFTNCGYFTTKLLGRWTPLLKSGMGQQQGRDREISSNFSHSPSPVLSSVLATFHHSSLHGGFHIFWARLLTYVLGQVPGVSPDL